VKRETNVVPNDNRMAFKGMVAEVRVPKLREELAYEGIGTAVTVGLDPRDEQRPDRVVDLAGRVGLLVKVATHLIVERHEARGLGLRGAARDALGLQDVEGTGGVSRISRAVCHSARIDRDQQRGVPHPVVLQA